jgi:hypothetical protein
MDKNKIGFVSAGIITSVLAPNRAKHFMTYSPRAGVKVNIVPGDSIPAAMEKAESSMYWDLQIAKIK